MVYIGFSTTQFQMSTGGLGASTSYMDKGGAVVYGNEVKGNGR